MTLKEFKRRMAPVSKGDKVRWEYAPAPGMSRDAALSRHPQVVADLCWDMAGMRYIEHVRVTLDWTDERIKRSVVRQLLSALECTGGNAFGDDITEALENWR